MVFNSFEFLGFFALTASVTLLLRGRAQRWFLLLASYVFYGSWCPEHIAYLFGTSVVAWYAGIALGRETDEPKRARIMGVALTLLLGQLSVLKYANFTIDSIESVAALTGWNVDLGAVSIALPLGVSFYTFQTVGYVLDVYWRRMPTERRFDAFALYVSFFPQLVSGPIERANRLIPQLDVRLRFDWDNLAKGAQLFLLGLFKKVVLADTAALYVSAVYNQPERHGGLSIALATFLFAFQIYGDFSGYTDMARGVARVFGVELMENFRQPFFATSVSETWRRWHISLSSWIGEYLHIPLAMKFRDYGNFGTVAAIMIAFVMIGLWHGANWTFVVFGAFQGLALSAEALTKRRRKRLGKRLPGWLISSLGIVYAFGFFCFGLVWFRSSSVSVAAESLRKIIVAPGQLFFDVALYPAMLHIGVMVCIDIWCSRARARGRTFEDHPLGLRWVVYVLSVLYVLQFAVEQGAQFIYFQF